MLTEELWERLHAPEGWEEIVDSHNKQAQTVRFTNGSVLYLRSCDRPDDLRGPNLGWFAIDEASKVPHKVWKLMIARLRISPEQGWIATTPRGRNWVWEEFAQKPRKDYEYFTGSTLENVHLSEDYKTSLLESYSGSFLAQEVYGQFVGWEGLVYSLDMEKHHADAPEPQSPDYKYALAGVDWGWVDPSVIVVGLIGFDGQIHIVDEFYEKKAPIEKIVTRAKELHEKWGIRTFWCDSARPEYIQELRNAGLDARKGKKALDPGIATVNKYLTDGRLKIDYNTCPHVIDEADYYHYEEDDLGQILKTKPRDESNHTMDAMRYMVYSQSKTGYVGMRGVHR